MQNYEILGLGSPLIDHVVHVDEAFLETIQAAKGSMKSVDSRTFRRLLLQAKSDKNPRTSVGGSCANTIRGLANLGHRCALTGKIGSDSSGETFIRSLKQSQIIPLLTNSPSPTGEIVCFITPDGERTFRDFLGASQEFSPDDLRPEMFAGTKLVHVEGYALMNGDLVQRAMELAKTAGAKISFDLSNYELVKEYQSKIIYLLSNYVDIVFGNREETHALTKCEPEKGCHLLRDLCEIVVTLMGPEGCWIGHGNELHRCFAYSVIPLDTTGAGDLFAAGFLHGYLNGRSLTECAHYGALAGAAVVKIHGADLPSEAWEALRRLILFN